jgi:outer membrane protein
MLACESIRLLVLAALVTGCATSAIEMAPERADRPWHPQTTVDGEIVPGRAGTTAPGDGYVLPSNKVLSTVPPPFESESGKAYSLPELIDIAESINPITRIAWNDARRAALAAGIVRSTYLPSIAVTAAGAWVDRSGHGSAGNIDADIDDSGHGAIAAATLHWLLFDFGERAAVLDEAQQTAVIANVAFTDSHQRVIHDVSVAFYAHAAARASVAAANQSRKNSTDVQAAAEDRFGHGVGTVIEVARARQGTAQADLAVIQAAGAERDAYVSLMAAIGISPLTKLEVADVSNRTLPSASEELETIVADALSRRPDVLSAYAAQKASGAHVRAAEAEFLPKFFVAATGAYNSNQLDVSGIPAVGGGDATLNLSGNDYTGTLLAGVTVPLYDGGRRAAALSQAKADDENAHVKLDRVRDEAVRQIVVADNALRTSLAAHRASAALEAASQTTFDAALDAYRNGVGSITDLVLAETQLLQARNAASIAYSAALSAAATLALATGALGQSP